MTAATWFIDKYRSQAQRLGVQQTARNLRKQGVPLEVALEVLAGRQPPPWPGITAGRIWWVSSIPSGASQ